MTPQKKLIWSLPKSAWGTLDPWKPRFCGLMKSRFNVYACKLSTFEWNQVDHMTSSVSVLKHIILKWGDFTAAGTEKVGVGGMRGLMVPHCDSNHNHRDGFRDCSWVAQRSNLNLIWKSHFWRDLNIAVQWLSPLNLRERAFRELLLWLKSLNACVNVILLCLYGP